MLPVYGDGPHRSQNSNGTAAHLPLGRRGTGWWCVPSGVCVERSRGIVSRRRCACARLLPGRALLLPGLLPLVPVLMLHLVRHPVRLGLHARRLGGIAAVAPGHRGLVRLRRRRGVRAVWVAGPPFGLWRRRVVAVLILASLVCLGERQRRRSVFRPLLPELSVIGTRRQQPAWQQVAVTIHRACERGPEGRWPM